MVLGLIISALASLIGGAVAAGKEVVGTISDIFQAVYSVFQSFVQAAPTPMKVFIFLTLLLFVGNIFSNFILGMKYVCTDTDMLYETEDIITGIATGLRLNFFSWSIAERNSYIADNYNPANTKPSMTYVKCVSQSPKVYFYTVNIFDYKLWMLFLILLYGAPLVWSYYSKMGVLH